jgi:hypothetical protein
MSQNWFDMLLRMRLPPEGSSVQVRVHTLNMRRGILRDKGFDSTAQNQTSDTLLREQAWQAMMPLSKFGKALGELNLDIDLLGIPAGRINLQRLLCWPVLKAFYRSEMSLDEMNHVNFDWYAPMNAHRQSPDEVRAWCASLGLSIEHERIEDAGITVVARKA